jgi:polyhydroxyalkanoate synthesis regulator phasin
MEKMMHEETKNYLRDIVIELHNHARQVKDDKDSKELRKVADDISDLLKKDRDATFRL